MCKYGRFIKVKNPAKNLNDRDNVESMLSLGSFFFAKSSSKIIYWYAQYFFLKMLV